MVSKSEPQAGAWPWWCWAYLGVLITATYVRLYFGVEITDESLYAVETYFPLMGDPSFPDLLLLQRTANFLLLPITILFNRFFGTTGMMLYIRHLHFFLALAAAWITYDFLKQYYRKPLAVICASFLIGFTPYSIQGWSYNNVTTLLLPMSLVLLWGASREEWFKPLLAGGLAAMTCYCYAPTVIAYLVVFLWLWANDHEEKMRFKASPRTMGFSIAIIVGGLLALANIAIASIGRIEDFLIIHRGLSYFRGLGKIQDILSQFLLGLKWPACLLSLPIFFILRGRDRRVWLAENNSKVLAVIMIVLAFLSRGAGPRSHAWIAYAFVVLYGFYGAGYFNRSGASRPEWLPRVLIVGVVTACVFSYSSANGLGNACMGLILPLQVLLLEATHALSEFKNSDKRSGFFLAAVGLFLCFCNYSFVYREDPIPSLTHQVKSGPFKWLLTTENRKQLVETANQDLNEIAGRYKTIFADRFVPAYMMTSLSPRSGFFFTNGSKRWTNEQVRSILYPTTKFQQWPDVVFIMKRDSPGYVNEFEEFFFASGRYERSVERPHYRILTQIRRADRTD